MTQRELMLAGEIYDPADPELAAEQAEYCKKLFAFNSLPPEDMPARERYYIDTFASVGSQAKGLKPVGRPASSER